MKRPAKLIFIIGLLSVPVQTQAQQSIPGASKPPVLTQDAADCALGMIKFMAAVGRGVEINVTEDTRQIWRRYLANNYPMLAPEDQTWFANACETLDANTNMFPRLAPEMRERIRQIWTTSVLPLLQFTEPVLLAAQQLRAAQQSAARSAINPNPAAELDRQRQMADSLMITITE
jgi:hypothetical protein